ncbi:lysine--tRNA ligase [Candidatus Purcelliella pentastirinorum]|uniref:lysine--tRNA ligase n=1 Tax=Candidatus Purcelliella pentastirinorum TaxID=472834 RepID=UPI002367C7B0|nr:lysine--tRNA ligase [Candidatus Purcelliella pentastirinorum]WDI78970.1 lysine--tRNA ligase [Candidatus Purcelliella pentastirinorum]WDR80106.1 lysine--tRNA ligase [Candidatus Purcelliella pentastirinorum]
MNQLKNNKKNQEIMSRLNKLDILRYQGFSFPNNFNFINNSKQIKKKYISKKKIYFQKKNINIKIAGRITNLRIMGKATFIVLQDEYGKIQLYFNKNSLINDSYKEKCKILDIGDIIGVKGKLFITNTKELSIYCNYIKILTKSLKPFPNKFHGVINKELKYRYRYLDLISNAKIKKKFIIRSKIIHEIRKFMTKNDFIEVETPMMQSIPGGGIAKPFKTYHNALNMNIYLRISPELFLKRLIIGGFNKIFEINRSFRNEGISTHHNPEFTMMELYIAYKNYKDLMKFTEKLLYKITKTIKKKYKIKYGNHIFNFKPPFKKMTMKESIIKYYPKITSENINNFNELNKIAKELNIKLNINSTKGYIIKKIFEKTVEPYLIHPTFITNYPIDISPLAKKNDINSEIADRFEFFINGHELANGFSELNDPEEQEYRFKKQIKDNNKYTFYDNEYIKALKYGLPPTAGLGIGIDRLIMILTNSYSIKDVILFPVMKPQK